MSWGTMKVAQVHVCNYRRHCRMRGVLIWHRDGSTGMAGTVSSTCSLSVLLSTRKCNMNSPSASLVTIVAYASCGYYSRAVFILLRASSCAATIWRPWRSTVCEKHEWLLCVCFSALLVLLVCIVSLCVITLVGLHCVHVCMLACFGPTTYCKFYLPFHLFRSRARESGNEVMYMFRTTWEFTRSRDCVTHSQNPEIAQAILRLCNTCAQSGDCVTHVHNLRTLPVRAPGSEWSTVLLTYTQHHSFFQIAICLLRMEVDTTYQGCLKSCELHSRSLAAGRTYRQSS